MNYTPYQLASWYFFLGLCFSLFSYDRPNGTHWGYALTGIACLAASVWFFNLHYKVGPPAEKTKESDWPANG